MDADPEFARTERLIAQLADALERVPSVSSGNQSTITLNAGGAAVWVISACCTLMLGLNVGLSIVVLRMDATQNAMREELSTTKAYLAGIWQQAPHLKPDDEKESDDE